METERKTIPVAAAIITQNDRILVSKRPIGKARALQYEFPGGKLEKDETAEAALIRECREEMGIELKNLAFFTSLSHDYGDIRVFLSFFFAQTDDEPMELEKQNLVWADKTELLSLDLCPADRLAAEMIVDPLGKVTAGLYIMQDVPYGDFTSKLLPNLERRNIIGVRVPEIRKYAKQLKQHDPEAAEAFLHSLPHRYYEENNLHAYLIGEEKDQNKCIELMREFLPYVDNWSTCDTFSLKALGKDKRKTLIFADELISSGETYSVRYGIGILMKFFLKDDFDTGITDRVADIRSEEYYVRMMQAWFFATALSLRYAESLEYIKNRRLCAWVHNKAIQKAVESRRISDDRKDELRGYRIGACLYER